MSEQLPVGGAVAFREPDTTQGHSGTGERPSDQLLLQAIRWIKSIPRNRLGLESLPNGQDGPQAGGSRCIGREEPTVDKQLERLTYTVEEVAELLGIGRRFAYEMVRNGEIPSVRLGGKESRGRIVGGRLLVPRHALQKWISQVGVSTASS